MILDPNLEQFATDSQWEKLKALEEGGSERGAAKILGVHKSAIGRAKKAVLSKAARGMPPNMISRTNSLMAIEYGGHPLCTTPRLAKPKSSG